MNKNTSSSTEKSTLDLVREFASELLQNGVDTSDVCFYLTAAGIELSFISAPTADHALNIISSAFFQVSKSRLSENQTNEADADDSAHEPEVESISNDNVDEQTIH